jgi:uncharacterized protein (TIGR01777 family)
MARILVTGATGLIGSAVVGALLARDDEVVTVSRDPTRARARLGGQAEHHAWPDPMAGPPPAEALAGADGIIHLLGEPVAQRWSAAAKREIRDSRVLSTRTLITGLRGLPEGERPRVLVSQSATGYYGPRADEPLAEDAPAGDDFLASVVAEWESAAQEAPDEIRVATTRTGVVLAAGEGALSKMLPFFRLGLGGPVAGGAQYVPWIHLDDVVAGLLHCLDDGALAGAVNLTAPKPVTNRELSRQLGRVLHRPAVLPVPALALRLLYGEMATIVVTGQNAQPRALVASGYRFRFPELGPALRDLLG